MNHKGIRLIIAAVIVIAVIGAVYSCGSSKGGASSTGTIIGTVNLPATSIGVSSYNLLNLLSSSQAGNAVSGATVRIEGENNETKTDDKGNFELKGVKKGQQVIDIDKTDSDGKKFKIREVVEVVAGQNLNLGTVDLEGTGAIYGTVTLADKAPGKYLGITVMLPDQELVALTDDNGDYAIAGVEPGTYKVVMSMTGYTDTTVGVNVTEGTSMISNVKGKRRFPFTA